MRKILKRKNGVTLVALVVTVIILLILAAITINLTIGENGIITTAKQAGKNYQEAAENEQAMLAEFWSETEGTISSATGSTTSQGSSITISLEDLNKIIDEKVAESKKEITEEAETKIAEAKEEMETKIAETKKSTNPAGTVIAYMGNNVPTGYLSCNGSIFNISSYPDLAAQIKTNFGSYNYFGGNGTTTFAVPDLRGEFLRGTGTASRNTGSGSSVGAHQNATTERVWVWGFKRANGDTNLYQMDTSMAGTVYNTDTQSTSVYRTCYKIDSSMTLDQTETSQTSIYTARPTNTSVLYCIKY